MQQQNNLAQTRSSVATNLIALYKALGGGWELRQGQPVVPEQTQDEMKERTNWGDMLSAAARAGNRSKPASRGSTRESPWPRSSRSGPQVDHRGGVAVVIVAFIGLRYWKAKQNALPEGIVVGQRPASRRSWSTSPPRSRCG